MPRSIIDRRDLRNALLCSGLVLGALVLVCPVAESGVNDDWSYTKTALDLARTGRIVYNGWSAAMLGAQVYWGALFIKAFGFSFLGVRLSTAPLAAGCAAFLYSLHRRAGLPPGLAVFGTLALALSPVFITSAATFMTDIPALFLLLASVYGYVRTDGILAAASERHCPPASWVPLLWGWLLFGLTAGLLSGTVRQTGWFVPVVAPGVLLLRNRSVRLQPALFPLAGSALVGLGAAMALAFWFRHQPCTVHDRIDFERLFAMEALFHFRRVWVSLMQTLGMLLFPVLVAVPALYRSWMRAQPSDGYLSTGIRLGGAALVVASFWIIAWICVRRVWVFPSFGNTFTPWPFLMGCAPAPMWSIPPTVPLYLWDTFRFCVSLLVCGAFAFGVVSAVWRRRHPDADVAPSTTESPVLALFAAFSIAYVPLLAVKGFVPNSFGIWDRYLLPVMPLATLGFLSTFHRWTRRERIPLYAWIALGAVAFYGVAQTHDYFAQLRARVDLTGHLEERGIARTRIMGGFEYDSWTQIVLTGCYNDPRVEGRPVPYRKPPASIGFETVYSMWRFAPVVQPEYVIALARHPKLVDADMPPVDYSCWLPPFDRQLVVQVRDPTLKVVPLLPATGERR